MKWLQKAYRHQLSEDRRYAVCAIGQGAGVFFEAWRSGKHEDGLKNLETRLETAEKARKVCEKDSNSEKRAT
jgi:hypothetical protein